MTGRLEAGSLSLAAPWLSLVIPAHNEETRLPQTIRRYGEALERAYGQRFEIIVVANGCSDRTASSAAAAAGSELPALRVLDIPERIGKGGALVEGIRVARGSRVAFADADGSTEVTSLLALVSALDRYDVAIGSRRLPGSEISRPQGIARRILSRAFNLAIHVLFRIPVADSQCGAKAFRRAAAVALVGAVRERGWTFDLDLLLCARRLGYEMVECPVAWGDCPGSRLRFLPTLISVSASLARLWLRHGPAGAALRVSSGENTLGLIHRPLRARSLSERAGQRPIARDENASDQVEALAREPQLLDA